MYNSLKKSLDEGLPAIKAEASDVPSVAVVGDRSDSRLRTVVDERRASPNGVSTGRCGDATVRVRVSPSSSARSSSSTASQARSASAVDADPAP